ncbi:MAG: T9SS type A sorting domain-containing protein [Ignavibacteria bacterium]|jgi:hypothetical protein|nr:T9SS type A sorting domain-containing protein [Ignavibacteria bacterium]
MKKALRRLIFSAFLLTELISSAAFAYTSPVYRARSSPPEFEVDSIAPKKGPAWGGTIVTIYGKKFLPNTTFEVRFGGIPGANVTRLDNQTLSVKSPRHPLSDLTPDTLQVTVTDLSEKTNVAKVSPDSFIYVRPGTKLSLLPASAFYNGTVELTATLTDSLNAPADSQTVTFTLGGQLAGTAITDTSGLAKLSVSISGVESGVHAGYIGAGFQENFFYKSSIPAQADLTVKPVQAILSLNSPVVNYGEGIELKAVLTFSGTPLTGKTVFFSVNNNPAGSAVTQSDGSASLTLTQPLDAGQYNIKAVFAEQGFDTTSAAGTLTINQAATSTTVEKVETSSGSIISLTARLTANGNVVKNAAIIFTIDGSISAGTAITNDEGTATLSGVNLGTLGIGPGTHAVSAGFAGNTNYKPSSASNELIVSQETTEISISGFEADYGSTIMLSAKLTSKTTGLGIKGAIINFAIEGGPQIEPAATNESGEASKSVNLGNTSPGTHNFTASFAGNSSYGPSLASAVITVKQQTPAATNILVEKSAGSFGGKTTLTAKLTNSSGTGLSGMKLHFKLNGADIGDTVTNAGGVAHLHGVSIAGIEAGMHENYIEASFSPASGEYAPSSGKGPLEVAPAATGISINNVEAEFGNTITLTAKLTSSVTGNGIANETVSFVIDGGPAVEPAKTNSDGVAVRSVNLGATSPGKHNITVSFGGSANYAPSQNVALLTVTQTQTATTLSVSNVEADGGGTVTLTAKLTSSASSLGIPGAAISFSFNDGPSAGTKITDENGIASLSGVAVPGNLGPGLHKGAIRASFSGNSQYMASSGSGDLKINKATSSLTVSSASGTYGGSTKLSAALKSGNSNLSGQTIRFYLKEALVGENTTGSDGVASYTASLGSIDAGTYPSGVKAVYAGSDTYSASSASNSLIVAQASTNLSAADAEADYGGKVTLSSVLTSTVTQSGIADKSVSFIIQGGPQITAVTNGSGIAAVSVDLGATSAGTHDITASFSPSGGNYTGSTAKGKLTVKGSVTSLAVTDLTGSYGGTVTLEAVLSSAGAGLQGKTIKFTFNNKTYSAETNFNGIAKVAEVSISGFDAGMYSGVIKAEFAGTGGYSYSSASGSLTVGKASTAIAVASVTGTPGGKVDLSAALTSGGSKLQGLTVRFELNNNPVGEAKTNDLGVATIYGITLPGNLSAGPHPGAIAAVFDGTNNYMPVQGSGTLTITQTPTAIQVTKAKGSYGGKVNLAAKLTSSSGIPLNSMKLHFKLNGMDINDAYTDEGGLAVLSGVSIAGIDAGLHDNYIQVSFSPVDNSYAPSTGYGPLEVTPAATTISISDMDADFGSTVTLTARLTSAVTGNGVENKTIVFRVDGAEVGNGTTGADGKAVKNYYLGNTTPGSHTVEAFFSPSGGNYSGSSGKAALNVKAASTALVVTNVAGTYGGKVTLTATLTSQGAPLSGKVVEFSLNNKTVGTAVTDANGIAVKTDVGLTGIPAGSYPGYIGASFAESSPFKGSSSKGDLEVKKAATAVAVLPVEVQYSDQVSLTAVVISAAQDVLNASGGRVEFKYQAGSQTAVSLGVVTSYSVVSGKLNFSFTFICTLAPDTYKILAVFTPSDQANFEVSCNISPWGPLVVKPEDALAEYSGLRYFSAAALSAYTSQLTFSSTVTDYPDASRGNISNAKAEFREVPAGELYDQGIVRGTNLPVSLLNSSDETLGIVTAQPFNRKLGESEINNCGTTFSVYTRIYGYYHALSDPALVSVCIPSTENISGGGFIIPNSPSGKYRCKAGSKASFGFSMKYSKTGKDVQGQVNIIVHAEDNKIYQITANAISTLSAYLIQNLPGKAASFTTRAELRDITDPSKPVFLGGGLTLNLEIYDDEKDNQNDAIAITLQEPGSVLLFSSNWDGTKTVSQALKAPKGGGTIRVLSIDNPVSVEEEEIVPKEYALYQNYPNPFNPSTNIQFDLPEESRVSIVIYNILGREVLRLVDKDFPAGRHQAVWNSQDGRGTFASGMYILRISAKSLSSQKSLVSTKKMMLVK